MRALWLNKSPEPAAVLPNSSFVAKADGLSPAGRMLFHVCDAVQFVARVKKIGVVPLADQFFEFGRAQAIFGQVAEVELEAAPFQKFFALAAGCAVRLVQKLRLSASLGGGLSRAGGWGSGFHDRLLL